MVIPTARVKNEAWTNLSVSMRRVFNRLIRKYNPKKMNGPSQRIGVMNRSTPQNFPMRILRTVSRSSRIKCFQYLFTAVHPASCPLPDKSHTNRQLQKGLIPPIELGCSNLLHWKN